MSLIDEMLQDFGASSSSKTRQRVLLAGISEKANNVLMGIDSLHTETLNKDDDKMIFDKETVQGLAKAVIQSDGILTHKQPAQDCRAILAAKEEFLAKQQIKYEFLSGSVRKLLAFNDTLGQLKNSIFGDESDNEMESDPYCQE